MHDNGDDLLFSDVDFDGETCGIMLQDSEEEGDYISQDSNDDTSDDTDDDSN